MIAYEPYGEIPLGVESAWPAFVAGRLAVKFAENASDGPGLVHAEEGVDHLRVELTAGLFPQEFQRAVDGPRFLVRATAGEGIEDIGHPYDAA